MNLSEIVKTNREKKEISQRELARRINVDNAFISRIEKGITKKPSVKILLGISRELEINIVDLLENANYTIEEIKLYNVFNSIGMFFDVEGENKKDLVKITDKGNDVISLIKILEEYKKNNLTLKETLGLISIQLNLNILEYISEKEINEYELNGIITFNNDKL